MKKGPILALLLAVTLLGQAQTTPEAAIRKLMAAQITAWNAGNLDEFMKGYWNNDSLAFIGKSGPTYGYNKTLANYKKNYNGPDQMGKLSFELLRIDQLSPDYCFVIGKFFLERKVGNASGMYTLLFRKIKGQWLIIVDHSS
ncbi:MAG: DUF4440 domain-containing protein [Bacteroidetes bacterium]|nr:DUF4440 domain-containing protein [Bacteroidota bacterium]